MSNNKDGVHIVTINVASKSDHGPVEMVSAEWIKLQRKRNEAARTAMKRYRAFDTAAKRLISLIEAVDPPQLKD